MGRLVLPARVLFWRRGYRTLIKISVVPGAFHVLNYCVEHVFSPDLQAASLADVDDRRFVKLNFTINTFFHFFTFSLTCRKDEVDAGTLPKFELFYDRLIHGAQFNDIDYREGRCLLLQNCYVAVVKERYRYEYQER